MAQADCIGSMGQGLFCPLIQTPGVARALVIFSSHSPSLCPQLVPHLLPSSPHIQLLPSLPRSILFRFCPIFSLYPLTCLSTGCVSLLSSPSHHLSCSFPGHAGWPLRCHAGLRGGAGPVWRVGPHAGTGGDPGLGQLHLPPPRQRDPVG